MTIKIKAPRAYALPGSDCAGQGRIDDDEIPVRIVREADWRRLMRLVRAAETVAQWDTTGYLHEALDALKGAK